MKYATILTLCKNWAERPEDSQAFTEHNRKCMGQMFPPLNSIMVRGYVPIRADYRCKEGKQN